MTLTISFTSSFSFYYWRLDWDGVMIGHPLDLDSTRLVQRMDCFQETITASYPTHICQVDEGLLSLAYDMCG